MSTGVRRLVLEMDIEGSLETSEFELVMARLHQAIRLTEVIQSGLRYRQDGLLRLEEIALDLESHRLPGSVVVERADNLRRAVELHVDLQLPAIREALIEASDAVADADASIIDVPGLSRPIQHVTNAATLETGQAREALQDVVDALGRVSRSRADDRALAARTSQGVGEAAGRLENARRSIYRLGQELPVITKALADVAAAAPGSLDANYERPPVTLDRLVDSAVAEMRKKSQLRTGVEPRANP